MDRIFRSYYNDWLGVNQDIGCISFMIIKWIESVERDKEEEKEKNQ